MSRPVGSDGERPGCQCGWGRSALEPRDGGPQVPARLSRTVNARLACALATRRTGGGLRSGRALALLVSYLNPPSLGSAADLQWWPAEPCCFGSRRPPVVVAVRAALGRAAPPFASREPLISSAHHERQLLRVLRPLRRWHYPPDRPPAGPRGAGLLDRAAAVRHAHPAREPAAAGGRRRRARLRHRGRGAVGPRRPALGRDRLHAGPGAAAGLHRRARHRRSGGDARRHGGDGRPSRRRSTRCRRSSWSSTTRSRSTSTASRPRS